MKTSRRAFVALAPAVAFATAAAGPSKAADPKEHYGMVVFLKGSEFFNWAYAGFQDEAATLGATTELQGPADWDASAEARAVDQLVAKGVKALRSRRAMRTLWSPRSTPA
jgi:ribose transport system substrate-binding protein